MTNKIDRTKSPLYNSLELSNILPIETFKLDNKVEVGIIKGGSQEIVKIDWIFSAGMEQAGRTVLATATGNLMREGTTTKSSQEISEMLDNYGSYLSVATYHHNSIVTLIALTKHLDKLLPLVEDMLSNPVFSQEEIDIYLNKKRQEYLVNLERVGYLTTMKFKEVAFGSNHIYGMSVTLDDYDKISREDIVKFHSDNYLKNRLNIVVAGQPLDNTVELLNSHFGKNERDLLIKERVNSVDFDSSSDLDHFVLKADAMQTSIKIGRRIITNHHKDFTSLAVVNTILGGYFGSRLMTTVREEKGLTYGISSGLQSYLESGIWMISSEVAAVKQSEAIEAVFEEMRKMREELISVEELEVVKNYMLGSMMRIFDGPFSTSDVYRNIKEGGLDLSYYQRLEDRIKSITPEEIKNISEKYLKKDDFFVIISGSENKN